MADRLLGASEVADELATDVQTVRRWIREGKLRAFKPGKKFRIRRADLEDFLLASEVRPKTPEETNGGTNPAGTNGGGGDHRVAAP